jgi:hypothetical protein
VTNKEGNRTNERKYDKRLGRALLVHKNDDKLFACTADIVIDVIEIMVIDDDDDDDVDVDVDITSVGRTTA